jgi:hypothetical protein
VTRVTPALKTDEQRNRSAVVERMAARLPKLDEVRNWRSGILSSVSLGRDCGSELTEPLAAWAPDG